SSISADARPRTAIRPAVGFRIPPMSLRSVDFPEPFEPMSPMVRPRTRSSVTSRSAHSSSPANSRRRPRPRRIRTNRSLTVESWRTETATSASGPAGAGPAPPTAARAGPPTGSDLFGQAVAQAVEHVPAGDQGGQRAGGHDAEVDPVRLPPEEEHVLVALDQSGDRVEEVQRPQRHL